MNFESIGGRGTTVVLLVGIFGINFFKSGGFPKLWGAMTGQYIVK